MPEDAQHLYAQAMQLFTDKFIGRSAQDIAEETVRIKKERLKKGDELKLARGTKRAWLHAVLWCQRLVNSFSFQMFITAVILTAEGSPPVGSGNPRVVLPLRVSF